MIGTLSFANLASSDWASGQQQREVANPRELSAEQKAQVRELESRNREVRAHEQAHASAGAGLAGAPNYTYETGPDGKRYAVGGEVPIHVRTSSSASQGAIQQYQQVARAALAPANPSAHDRAVAAQAQVKIAELHAKLALKGLATVSGSVANQTGTAQNADANPAAALIDSAASAKTSFAAYRSIQAQQSSSPNPLRGAHVSLVA